MLLSKQENSENNSVKRQRVVATLTTLPGRYEKLIHTIASIKDQVDCVYITLPQKVKRLQQTYPDFPEEISKYVKFVKVGKDYGPITKILGALYREYDADTLIVSIDDDMIYPADLVSKLIANLQHQPKAVITTGGYSFCGSFIHFMLYHNKFPWLHNVTFPHVKETGRQIEQLYGCSGVLYRRSYFNNETLQELLNKSQETYDLFLNDDVVISAWLARNNIPIYVFPNFTPCVELNSVRDGNELSYIPLKMYYSMHRAYNYLYEWGFNKINIEHSFTDSIFGMLIVIIVLFLLFVFFCILVWQITRNYKKPLPNSENLTLVSKNPTYIKT
jgi:hypothetical protein